MSFRLAIAAIAVLATASPSTASQARAETAVLAGGCFWGVEAVFEHVRGVNEVVSGYAGGVRTQGSGNSLRRNGYAEAVRIRFDPSQVSFEQLLDIYFTVAHDPTQFNRQGPDVGPAYRSAVFPQNLVQKRAASATIARLQAARAGRSPIRTRIETGGFDLAAPEHQDYVRKHPSARYVVINDLPKLRALRQTYPALWRD